MIVRSPLKDEQARPNLRKVPVRDHGVHPDSRANPGKRDNYHRLVDGPEDKKRMAFPRVKPWMVILGAFVAGVLGVLYLSHVFATQELLEEVQQLEQEYNQARRMNAEYRLTYDRMTGPAEIYEKAKELGLVDGGPAEKIIEVEKQ